MQDGCEEHRAFALAVPSDLSQLMEEALLPPSRHRCEKAPSAPKSKHLNT